MTCNHPDAEKGGEIIEPREFIQAWGPTVGKSIPKYPGSSMVMNDANSQVFISRLECGHFWLTSSYIVAQARAKQAAALMAQDPTLSAKAAYTALLEKALQGEEVSAHEAAEAQAAIILEEKAAEGRRQRAEAERLRAEGAHRKAIAGPVRQELQESRENLQNAQDEAFRAIMTLLDLVDQDHKTHDDAIAQLLNGGFNQDEIKPPARGYLHETVADGESFPIWPKMEHLVAVLNAVKYSRHRNAFYSVEGRNLGENLPSPIPNGPGISQGVDEG